MREGGGQKALMRTWARRAKAPSSKVGGTAPRVARWDVRDAIWDGARVSRGETRDAGTSMRDAAGRGRDWDFDAPPALGEEVEKKVESAGGGRGGSFLLPLPPPPRGSRGRVIRPRRTRGGASRGRAWRPGAARLCAGSGVCARAGCLLRRAFERPWRWRENACAGCTDRKSTRLNSSHSGESRMPSSA